MMRSLWAGVTGLQAHQIAMDVEGHNIANVNTTGFKYGRANFSDLLSQTAKVATAPQGELGGKNPMQIGLGTQINSVTKIFKQGSVQTTDKNTDLAIQGDGFFVISPDGGKTYKYTRNGDFVRDAKGNFVDNNGYIAQGWMRDEVTGEVDTTAPVKNIVIKPGLTTPANPTKYISLKANLNSGNEIGDKKTPIYQLDAQHNWMDIAKDGTKQDAGVHSENDLAQNTFITDSNKQLRLNERGVDMGVLFNGNGESLGLRKGQGVWVSFAEARTKALHLGGTGNNLTAIDNNGKYAAQASVNLEINGTQISGSVNSASELAAVINAKMSETGVRANIINGNQIQLVNDNKTGTTAASKNILVRAGSAEGNDTTGILANGNATAAPANNATEADNAAANTISVVTAYQYTYDPNPVNTDHALKPSVARAFNTTEDLREAMQHDARLCVNYDGRQVPPSHWATEGTKNDGVEVIVDAKGEFVVKNPKEDALNEDDGDVVDLTTEGQNRRAEAFWSDPNKPAADQLPEALKNIANTEWKDLTSDQKKQIITEMHFDQKRNANTNVDDFNMYLSISSLTDPSNKVNENYKFMKVMQGMQGALTGGDNQRQTQGLYMSAHSSSLEIFDSLGTKHSIKYDFAKIGYTDDGGTEWSLVIQVPEPGAINTAENGPKNVLTGSIRFNSDGSLQGFSPSSISFTANNGSEPNQNIEFNFGNANDFDGLTSYDRESNTSGISQDGYPGGDLNGIRVDESGTLIGSFTNGRSFGLAQIAMATFTNNEGLEADGGNVFSQTSNSGEPVIGAATTGGRGKVQASSLEMSNVDLSRSLTQLIVIQRGYQANSKTITTSDQMLNTLLQLKQ